MFIKKVDNGVRCMGLRCFRCNFNNFCGDWRVGNESLIGMDLNEKLQLREILWWSAKNQRRISDGEPFDADLVTFMYNRIMNRYQLVVLIPRPVAFSLMASFMSAITLIGVSNENYQYGTQFIVINLAYGLATPIVTNLFLPVFYNMRVTSAYEVSLRWVMMITIYEWCLYL